MASAKSEYKIGERVAILRLYYQNGQNPTQTVTAFSVEFGRHETIIPPTVNR